MKDAPPGQQFTFSWCHNRCKRLLSNSEWPKLTHFVNPSEEAGKATPQAEQWRCSQGWWLWMLWGAWRECLKTAAGKKINSFVAFMFQQDRVWGFRLWHFSSDLQAYFLHYFNDSFIYRELTGSMRFHVLTSRIVWPSTFRDQACESWSDAQQAPA